MKETPNPQKVIDRGFEIANFLNKHDLERYPCGVNDTLLDQLEDALRASEEKYALFGYFDHKNVGDQALWFTLLRLVQIASQGVSDSCVFNNLRRDEAIRKSLELLIFPGGGSLGNRYGSSKQRVTTLINNPTVSYFQMPISTSFVDDPAELSRLKNGYTQERGVVFCRDKVSASEAEEKIGLNATVHPDLVEMLPSCERFNSQDLGTIVLLRRDQESTGVRMRDSKGSKTSVDWEDIVMNRTARNLLHKLQYRMISSRRVLPTSIKNWSLLAKHRFRLSRNLALFDTSMALSYLSFFSRIVTDRLHGVILARNLGLNIEYLDNDHGKLSRYVQSWPNRYRNIMKLDSLEDSRFIKT